MSKFWNGKVKTIEPYVPGEQPKDKKYIKLNTNENPYSPSPKVIRAMKNAMGDDLKLYPDPNCSEVIKSISNYYNIEENQIFVGNGSDEVLALSFMTFFEKGEAVLFPDITYSFYTVYADLFNLDYELIPLTEEFEIDLENYKKENGGIILPNPNAPTTKYIEREKLQELIEYNKNSVVIIDEAYIDFGGESMVEFINKYPNLLVIQTLSKSRALAGLRFGFALGNKELIEGLNRVKNSFNSYTIDRVALAGAKAAIEDKEYFEEITEKIINTRNKTRERLRELNFNVLDSKANFLFVSHNIKSAEEIFKKLREDGILVRYFNKKRIDNFLRITIGTDKEMDYLINSLKKIL